MDLSSANQLAGFVRRHRDVRLWILDEDGLLYLGGYPAGVGRVGEWPIITLSTSRWLGVDRPAGQAHVLKLDQITAVKVPRSAGHGWYFGDRRRMVEAEIAAGLDAAEEEQSAGRYVDALVRSEECRELMARELEPDHPSVARALASAADALRRLGRFRLAAKYADRASALARNRLDRSDPILPAVIGVLACLHADMGELEAARPLAEEVLELLLAQGAGEEEIGDALATLSYVDCRRGFMGEAARLAREGLARLLHASEPAELRTRARLLHNLGMALALTGELEDARSCLEESMAERERLLGPAHPEAIEGTSSLGTLHFLLGDAPRAVEFFRDALARAELTHGPDHFRVADYAVNLAVACRKLGTRDAALEAEALLERGSRIRRVPRSKR